MTPGRLVLWLLIAVVLEAAVFQLAYRDLLWLNRPVAELRAAEPAAVDAHATSVLAREHLSRRQLEALAAATAGKPSLRADYVAALERLHALSPEDLPVRVRLAEAYRLAGRLDEARVLLTSVLQETGR